MNNHHPRNDWDGGLFNGPHPGISIRMWLAGQALAALVVNETVEDYDETAAIALRYADALLREYIAQKQRAAREDVGGRE